MVKAAVNRIKNVFIALEPEANTIALIPLNAN